MNCFNSNDCYNCENLKNENNKNSITEKLNLDVLVNRYKYYHDNILLRDYDLKYEDFIERINEYTEDLIINNGNNFKCEYIKNIDKYFNIECKLITSLSQTSMFCYKCIDCNCCVNCKNCNTCKKCIDCNSCTSCENSEMLTNCYNCHNCYSCENCKACQKVECSINVNQSYGSSLLINVNDESFKNAKDLSFNDNTKRDEYITALKMREDLLWLKEKLDEYA
jgi:hypothetical protein